MLKVWIWCVIFLIVFGLTVWGTRRLRSFIVPKNHTHNEFLRIAHQFLGLIYGVLLAVMVVFSWQNYTNLNKNLDLEVTSLTDVWYDSEVFPCKSQVPFHAAVVDYLQSIQKEEWPLMAKGIPPHANPAYTRVWETANRLQVKTELQKAFLTNLVDELNNVNSYRMNRIFAVKGSIPCILWIFLISGAFCMIILTELYNANVKLRTLLSSVQALILVFTFYLIANFNHPFQGSLALKNDAYKSVSENLIKLQDEECK
jgi:hypothetical protein